MMVTLEGLLKAGPDAKYLLVGDESDLDKVRRDFRAVDSVARIIRGQRCTRKPDLFQEWSSVLEFPSYFGANWDAFEECLNDLEWIPESTVVVIVANIDCVLPHDPEEWFTLLSILKAIQNKQQEMTINHTIYMFFHCSRGNEKASTSRLEAGEVSVRTVAL